MPEGTWRSPDNLLKAAKDVMLEGRDPESDEDWQTVVNFWALNVHPDVQPSAIQLMCTLYKVPVTDGQVKEICKFQALERIRMGGE